MKTRFSALNAPITLLICGVLTFLSCKREAADTPVNEPERITTVYLNFHDSEVPATNVNGEYFDPDGPGAVPATVDTIRLEVEKAYRLLVLFYDDLASEGDVSINRQVRYEDKEHQICFATSGIVPAPLIQDFDDNGNPVGRESFFNPTEVGTGTLQITLRHQPDKEAADPCGSGIVDVETLEFPIIVE
ncbi:hypothetical protein [Flavilitoribacter nigricans]|nr:hypothetical protein [Flavilitoribacter nigricans]